MKWLLLGLLVGQPAMAIDFNDPATLVEAAVERHPALSRLRAEAAAAAERELPAQALPNPMVMAGVQDKMIDLRDDEMMTMYMVGASQTLVRGEKRQARRNIARLAVVSVENEVASVRAEIERDVLLAWYALATADSQIAAAERVREMVDAITAAARVRYEVGSALQADVIRAQLQRSDLDLEILRLTGERRTALARLATLVGIPLDTSVPRVAMPENTDDLAIDAPITPPDEHPAISALEAEVARADEEIRLARAELKPDINIEAEYGYRRLQRDMFSVTARVELPFRRDQTIEPRIREAILRREAAQARIAELRLALTQAMAEAFVAHEDATNQIVFHQQVLVPQAQLAFESTLAAYQTGRAPFDAILATETAYLRLRLQYYDFLARHAGAVVNYEALRRGARTAAMIAAPMSASSAAAPASSSNMNGM